jgi:hypothetical protein
MEWLNQYGEVDTMPNQVHPARSSLHIMQASGPTKTVDGNALRPTFSSLPLWILVRCVSHCSDENSNTLMLSEPLG